MGTYLTRDAILAATSLATEEVEVPAWGGTVVVRELDGESRDEWEATTWTMRNGTAVQDLSNARAKLVALSIVDHETGEPMFTRQDVYALGKLSGTALAEVFSVACRLSGLAFSIEEAGVLEGKSSDPDGGGSPSS